MEKMDGCQLPNLPNLSEGHVHVEGQSMLRRAKRSLAVPWNYYVKRWIKQAYHIYVKRFGQDKTKKELKPAQLEVVDPVHREKLNAGDWVQVRSWEEIRTMLDPFKETHGCAFLEDMHQYCGTTQQVFKPMDRFLDERDYKVKKVSGVILLKDVICNGTPAFGKCDRSCFLFWREEWLEKISS